MVQPTAHLDANGSAAEAVACTLKSMRSTESGEQAESHTEATEERRQAEQAVPEPVAEQRVPDPPGLSAWEDPPTGVLARLLARISQDGTEAYAAVEELRRFVSAQIRREIRALTETIEARFSVQNTKIEHHTAMINRNTAMIDRHSEEIKALTTAVHNLTVVVATQSAKIDSLRWMLGIVILLLMALAAMGMSNYLFPQSPVNSPNTVSESAPAAPVAAPAAPQGGGAAGSVPTGPAAGTAEALRPESAPALRAEP